MIQVGQFLIALFMLILMLMWDSPVLQKIDDKYFYKIIYAIYLLTRFGGIILLFYIFNRPGPGDLMNHFYREALAAGNGQLVYNDFPSRYSFLFPYLISPLVILFRDRVSVVLIFAIFDLLLLLISQKYITAIFDINKRHFVWIYVFCPLLFITTVYWAQDEIILAVFVTTAFILMKKQKELGAVLVMVAGFYFTKFISVYFYLPLLIFMNKKRYIWIFIAGLIVPNLILYTMGIDIMMPLKEGAFPPEGTSIWHLFRRAGLPYNNVLSYIILFVLTIALFSTQLKNKLVQSLFNKLKMKADTGIIKYTVISTLIFMAFSAKSYSYYFVVIIVFYLIMLIKNSEFSFDRIKIVFFNADRFTLELSLYLFVLSIAPIGDNFLRELKVFNTITFFSYILILITFVFHIRLIVNLFFKNRYYKFDEAGETNINQLFQNELSPNLLEEDKN